MKKVRILVHGKQPEILDTLLRLINKNVEWTADGSLEEEELIERFQRNNYDLVLLGGGISEVSEKKIRAIFHQQRPELPIIQHYGGGSGLLQSEITAALNQSNQGKFQIVDNPFE